MEGISDLWKLAVDFILSKLIKNEKLFVRHTVKELAFDGYHDILLALASIFEKNPPFPGNTFGWFYGVRAFYTP